MPEICRFFGIAIAMYYNDHLPPHFHAGYGEFEAVYAIESLELLRGSLPRRAHGMVVEWALGQRPALLLNWERARDQVPLEPVAPLD
jgi:hypothetical protein